MIGTGLSLTKQRRAGSSGPAYLLRDTFTDADGTALTAHAMDVGSGWTVLTGSWSVQGNRARQATTGGAYYRCYANAGAADGTLDVVVPFGTVPTHFNGGIAARIAPGNASHWMCGPEGLFGPWKLRVYEFDGAGFVLRASADVATPSNNTSYTLRVALSGQSITCTWDVGGAANEVSYGSAAMNQATQTHGMVLYADTGSYAHKELDGFQMTP